MLVKSATWDNTQSLWKINTTQGEDVTCRYFIPATGALSVGKSLPFPGVEKFKGESYITYAWPHRPVDFKGNRVGIIGTGATSVQMIPTIAHAATSVTVFQRTANYVLPARNHPLTSEQQEAIKRNYNNIWQEARRQMYCMAIKDSTITTKDMKNDTAIQRVLECGWEIWNFHQTPETRQSWPWVQDFRPPSTLQSHCRIYKGGYSFRGPGRDASERREAGRLERGVQRCARCGFISVENARPSPAKALG